MQTLQELPKRLKVMGDIFKALREAARQLPQAGSIEHKGIDVSNHMAEPTVFIETIPRATPEHCRSEGGDLQACLRQELLMPVGTLRHCLIHHEAGRAFHHPSQILQIPLDSTDPQPHLRPHRSTPSSSMRRSSRGASRSASRGTRSTRKSRANSARAASASPRRSGGTPSTARSISERSRNHGVGSEPKARTRRAPKRSFKIS